MPSFGIISRMFVAPAVVAAAQTPNDESGYHDFVKINAPVTCVATCTTVQDDYIHVAASSTNVAASTADTVSTHLPIQPGEAVVMQKAKSIIVMLSGDEPQVKVLTTKQCIAFIANLYINQHPQHFALTSHQFREGISTLGDCSNFLQAAPKYTEILSVLKGIYRDSQVALCQAIMVIIGDANWPTAAPDPDFDISPLTWLLKLGPLGLAAGFIKGKVVAEILLQAEEQCIAANIEDEKYEDKKVELQLFACELCGWAEMVLTPRKRVAKVRKVRVVGLT